MAQLVGHHPTNGMVAGSISGQGTCLGCWFGPGQGVYERQRIGISHIDISLPLFLLPFSSFSKKKENV